MFHLQIRNSCSILRSKFGGFVVLSFALSHISILISGIEAAVVLHFETVFVSFFEAASEMLFWAAFLLFTKLSLCCFLKAVVLLIFEAADVLLFEATTVLFFKAVNEAYVAFFLLDLLNSYQLCLQGSLTSWGLRQLLLQPAGGGRGGLRRGQLPGEDQPHRLTGPPTLPYPPHRTRSQTTVQ